MDDTSVDASFVCVFYDAEHEDETIFDFLRARFEGAAILGGTSCNGVMNQDGLSGPGSIGLLVLEDPDGNYGTAAGRLQGDAADCAERVLHAALEAADCSGELPELVWIYQAPGQEEAVIEGLRRVVGDRCPIIGGSSADNDVSGQWRQMGPEGALCDGLVVGVLFSSGGIGYAFQGGYEPSGESGIVTQSRGRRIISIDGEPAAQVYNRWIGGLLEEKLNNGGNVLADTTMHPVGVDAGKIEGVTSYRLIHPEKILPDGVLSTFASIEEGTRLYSMKGERARLITRAGKVASAAAAMLPGGKDNLAGGLVVYCGAIEGEALNAASVRSSVARRLGVDIGALAPVDRHVDGIVDMVLDATGNANAPLTTERLFGWLKWFLAALLKAVERAHTALDQVLAKVKFWGVGRSDSNE